MKITTSWPTVLYVCVNKDFISREMNVFNAHQQLQDVSLVVNRALALHVPMRIISILLQTRIASAHVLRVGH